MTLTYTPRFKLAVPDFLSEPWHSEFAQAMESIDQILYNALIAQSVTMWLNSTSYTVGNLVINPDSGAIFTCSFPHTSTASPQTFTQELIAHPTFWTVLAPTLATQAEAEAGAENTKYMSPLRTKQGLSALQSQTSPVVPHSGQFYANSATLLGFTPYNGNLIKINGVLHEIPTAGIAGLGNTGVFVSATPGQNLAADTTYLVTAFDNAGVVTANFNAISGTTTHRPSEAIGNEGVEVLFDGVEFPGYTLIGIVRTSNTGTFLDTTSQRYVRSWFNRYGTPMQTWLSASANTASNTYVEIASGFRLSWVNFRREAVRLDLNVPVFSTAGLATGIHLSIGVDDITPENAWNLYGTLADLTIVPASLSLFVNCNVGHHYATPLYHTTGGVNITARTDADANGSRATFRGMVFANEGNTDVA